MYVVAAWISTEVSDEQYENASAGIYDSVAGSTTDVSAVHPENACSLM